MPLTNWRFCRRMRWSAFRQQKKLSQARPRNRLMETQNRALRGGYWKTAIRCLRPWPVISNLRADALATIDIRSDRKGRLEAGGRFLSTDDQVLMFDPCDATHCHVPFGIFTQTSVQRACISMGLPFSSVPFASNTMLAIAVPSTAVTCKSLISTLVYFVAFALANVCARLLTVPSVPVLTSLSDQCAEIRSGLFVFCDCVHFSSRAAIVFSVVPVCCACARVALPSKTKPTNPPFDLVIHINSL